jgi:hypothetical protein
MMKGRRTLWVAGTNDRAELWQQLVAELLTDGDVTRVGKVALHEGPAKHASDRPPTLGVGPF